MLIAAVLAPFLYRNLTERLPFPSITDQDEYLREAQLIAHDFTFPETRQLYSSWLAIIYILSGNDPQRCFYIEKTISVLLFCLLMAFLAFILFDVRTALLAFVWVLNCKYMVLEPNGSHALAASMVVGSALCFFLPNRALRAPASWFILLLSIKVRDEMIVPLAIVSICLVIRFVWRWKRGGRPTTDPRAKYYWIGAAVIWIMLVGLFAARHDPKAKPYLSIVLRSEFSGTYVNRTGLSKQLPGKRGFQLEAWDLTFERLPDVNTDMDVIRLYPREELANILYNLKITPRVAAAMFLAFDHPLIMAATFLMFLLSFIVWRDKRGFQPWRPMTDDLHQRLIIWATGTISIVGLIVCLYISARHYVQLIPVEIIATLFLIRFTMGKLLPSTARSRSVPTRHRDLEPT